MVQSELFEAIEETWPAKSKTQLGSWTIRYGANGGKRVCATSLEGSFDGETISIAEDAMQGLNQENLFMIRGEEPILDQALQDRGYEVIDPVVIYEIAVAELTKTEIPAVSAFPIWPPMAIQKELWQRGGIGPDRLNVMARVQGAKTAILARVQDKPAGVGFVAIHGHIAMLHAIEVSPELRRCGVGANIVRAAAHWCKTHGASTLALVVTRANTPANGLYTSLGMKLVGHYHYRLKS